MSLPLALERYGLAAGEVALADPTEPGARRFPPAARLARSELDAGGAPTAWTDVGSSPFIDALRLAPIEALACARGGGCWEASGACVMPCPDSPVIAAPAMPAVVDLRPCSAGWSEVLVEKSVPGLAGTFSVMDCQPSSCVRGQALEDRCRPVARPCELPADLPASGVYYVRMGPAVRARERRRPGISPPRSRLARPSSRSSLAATPGPASPSRLGSR